MRLVEPASAPVGHIAVPGGKSVSHRSLLVGAVAEGETRIRGFGASADTQATVDAVRAMGVQVDEDGDELVVHGVGLGGLRPPDGPIDCANSGTLMRLLSGLAAGNGGALPPTGGGARRPRAGGRGAPPPPGPGAAGATGGGRAA